MTDCRQTLELTYRICFLTTLPLSLTGSVQVLCLYFTLIVYSKDFTQFMDEEYTEDWFRKDKSGVEIQDLVSAGGSLAEFLEFSSLAKINSKQCGDDGAPSTPRSRKSKNKRITEFFKSSIPPKKMTKLDQMETGFKKECKDKDALSRRVNI